MLPELVSQYFLEKGGRQIILQGMIHVSSARFYEKIQLDINDAASSGWLLLYEGIHSNKEISLQSRKAKRLQWYFTNAFKKLYPAIAKKYDVMSQQCGVIYPSSAVCVDVSTEELANVCVKRKVPYSWFLHSMSLASLAVISSNGVVDQSCSPLWFRIVARLGGGHRLNAWFKKSLITFYKELKPIVMDYRNERIFEQVLAVEKERNLFLLYGEAHLPELIKLFGGDGWTVRNVAVTNINLFTATK